jgi:hypothetical protein
VFVGGCVCLPACLPACLPLCGWFTLGSQEEDMDMVGPSSAKKTKFSRLAWGLEIWDLMRCSIELMYEPELQVRSLDLFVHLDPLA